MKYIIEIHQGDDAKIIKRTSRNLESIENDSRLLSLGIGVDQVLLYKNTESIVCGYKKGERISFKTEAVYKEEEK